MSVRRIDNRAHKVFRPAVLKRLKNEAMEKERLIKTMGVYHRGDPDGVKREIAKLNHKIELHSPPKLRGYKKDKLAKEKRELEETIKPYINTDDEANSHDRQILKKAIKKELWLTVNGKLVERLKEINNILEPDDDERVGIEYLRRN